MSRRHKKRRAKNTEAIDSPLEAKVPLRLGRERRSHILRQALLALGLTLVVSLGLHAVETLAPVRAVVEYAYDWLQGKLTPVGNAKAAVAVVDISNLQLVRDSAAADSEPYTPRPQLRRVVESIIVHDPAAIGIDVDFSLTAEGEYFTADDREFLDFLLQQRQLRPRTRLFVGIASGLEKGPAGWLGDEKYHSLAAHILRPNAEAFGPNPRMDEYIELPRTSGEEGEPWRLPSLAAALAGAPAEAPAALRWALERRIEHSVEGVSFRQFLVDFSPIDDFARNVIVTADGSNLSDRTRFTDKIVVVGRGSKGLFPTSALDSFTVPGHRQEAYPGMLLHTCAAYTLRGATLWELKEPARLLLDFLFSIAVFGTVAIVALFYSSRVAEDVAVHRLSRWLTGVMVLAVMLIGPRLAAWGRIMWPDYVVVALGLVLHSSLEQHDSPIRVTLQALRRGWHAIGFASSDKGHTP